VYAYDEYSKYALEYPLTSQERVIYVTYIYYIHIFLYIHISYII
jgi:hypothetical protein